MGAGRRAGWWILSINLVGFALGAGVGGASEELRGKWMALQGMGFRGHCISQTRAHEHSP